MRIPTGEFGNRVATRPATPLAGQEAFGGGAPQAIGELAAGVKDVGRVEAQIATTAAHDSASEAYRLAREAEAERKQLEREAKRAESMVIHAKAQSALAAEADRINLGISDGTIDKTKAGEIWTQSSQKIVQGFIGQVDKSNADLVRAGLENDLGVNGRRINQAVVQRNRQDIGAGLETYLNEQERFAVTDLNTAIKQAHMALDGLGPQAGLSPDKIAKAKQAFTESATFNVARKFLIENRNNGRALNAFVQSLPSNKNLDPQKATILEGQAMGYITRLENQAIAAENRRIALAGTTLNRISTLIDNGLTPDPKMVDDAIKLAKGTPYEAAATGLIQDQKFMADLSKLPPQEQVSFVKEARAKYMKDGATPEDWAALGRMERTVKRTIEQIQTQPLAYAATHTGAQVTPLDLTNPDSWGENLKSRTTILLGQHRQLGGQSSLSGLMPEEIGALKSVLRSSTPAVQADVLAKLRQGFGDASVFAATMAQIAPDDPVTAKAGIFAARGLTSMAGKSVATEILQGVQILRPDPKADGKPGKGGAWPMPKEQDLMREWESYTGTAYSGRTNMRNADFQAAKALYASRAVAEGDQTGEINTRRWRAAMALVTGGISRHAGQDLILPYGMTAGEFKDGLAQRAQAFKVDPSVGRIDALPLVPVDDGKYVPRVGDALLLDESGKPVVIDFNTPVAKPAKGQAPAGETIGGAVTGRAR